MTRNPPVLFPGIAIASRWSVQQWHARGRMFWRGRSAPMREARVARPKDVKDLDRRNFLQCMAWVGTGAVWTLSSGILKGSPLGQSNHASMMSHGGGALRFIQISDSHIGFDKPANTD